MNCLGIKLLGVIDGLFDGIAGLTRQTDNKGPVDQDAKLMAVARELLGLLHQNALLDVVKDLLVTRFIAHQKQP